MNAAILLIPFVLIRYGLMGLLGGDALRRAAHYPETEGPERAFHWIYQIASLLLLIVPFFLKLDGSSRWLIPGLFVYGLGIVVTTVATVSFSRPQADGFKQDGLYRFSRNPMYVGYFLYFLGCVVLTVSWALLAALALFQLSTHFLIRSEERWCLKKFGDEYAQYAKKVRRYL
jgi:protein-S-isoprenylcysteine O-methyltransferase Ste14